MNRPDPNDAAALPSYAQTSLAGLQPGALIALLVRDEDRVPRNLIDDCAGRGDAMIAELRTVLERGKAWQV